MINFDTTHDAERRAQLFIDQMEAEQPAVWNSFLEILGLHSWLGRFMVASPFNLMSPSYVAILDKIAAVNSDFVGSGIGPIEIFHALQRLCRANEEIWARMEFTSPETDRGRRLLLPGVRLSGR